jgi:Tfp pilus assembly protein PilF
MAEDWFFFIGFTKEQEQQSSFGIATSIYQASLDYVLATCGNRKESRSPPILYRMIDFFLPLKKFSKVEKIDSKVLELLVARDKVANEIAQGKALEPEILGSLAMLDQTLKSNALLVTNCVSKEAFSKWRDTVQPSEKQWWWHLDERSASAGLNLDYIWALLMWIIIAISLSYIVETVRRFLSGGVDILSTVLQGLLGLLVGGTLVQLAWQFVESVKSRTQDKKVRRWQWTRLAFVLLLISIAFLIRQSLPRIASYYSNQCTNSLLDGDTSNAMKNCQRAVSLRPNDANAHWVLGKAYEAMYEYDKAQDEFKATILYDDRSCKAYNDLSYLYIVQRKDYSGALRLLNTALEKCERSEVQNPTFFQDEKSHIEYALYKNRGWAYLGLEKYWLAEKNILQALKSRDFGAEAYCLLAQVTEKKEGVEAAKDYWCQCVDFARSPDDEKGEKDDVEPNLFSIARERAQQSGLDKGGSQ